MEYEITKKGHVVESSSSLQKIEETLGVEFPKWDRIVGEDYSKTQVFNVKCERRVCQVIKTLYR